MENSMVVLKKIFYQLLILKFKAEHKNRAKMKNISVFGAYCTTNILDFSKNWCTQVLNHGNAFINVGRYFDSDPDTQSELLILKFENFMFEYQELNLSIRNWLKKFADVTNVFYGS